MKSISHNRTEESPEQKARWFQSLPVSDRMDLLCEFTDLILENNPAIKDKGCVEPIKGRIQVLSKS